MAEYIEREAAKNAACEAVELYRSQYAAIEESIDNIPAADVAPVRNGRWEIYREPEWPEWAMRLMCSACGLKTSQKSQYFPNCGAKMDGGEQDA